LCSHCCSGKAVSIIFWVCLCCLSYPACAILSSLVCPAVQNFSHYLVNGKNFEKKIFNLCLDFTYTFNQNISRSNKAKFPVSLTQHNVQHLQRTLPRNVIHRISRCFLVKCSLTFYKHLFSIGVVGGILLI